ncbi:response regulator [Rubritepida flocculans]|uniref:response regulator n=1 Tax=Rubritepida flocculans TaxID=182403 RepID=UPI00041E3C3D|nr:response regulator [Rubritepida flocculans]
MFLADPEAAIERAGRTERTARLLLLDPCPASRGAMLSLLEQAGCEALPAGDAASGLAILAAEEGGLDALLLGLGREGGEGLEALRRLRAPQAGGAGLPVLALTGSGTALERACLLREGVEGWLAPPFRPERLREAVREVLEAGRAIGRAEELPVWDEAIRAELDALPDELRAEIRAAFARELPALLQRLEAACLAADHAAARAAAHALAGCAASFGASRLSALARVAERAAGRQDIFAACAATRRMRSLALPGESG